MMLLEDSFRAKVKSTRHSSWGNIWLSELHLSKGNSYKIKAFKITTDNLNDEWGIQIMRDKWGSEKHLFCFTCTLSLTSLKIKTKDPFQLVSPLRSHLGHLQVAICSFSSTVLIYLNGKEKHQWNYSSMIHSNLNEDSNQAKIFT